MTPVLAVLLCWGCGELFLSLFCRRTPRQRLADVPLAFALGSILFYIFWLLINRVTPHSVLPVLFLPAGLGAAILTRKNRPVPIGPSSAWTAGEKGLLAAILLVLAVTALLTLTLPLLDWESRILWALKAKFLAAAPTLTSEPFVDPYYLHIHPRYPLLVPWLAALIAGSGTHFSESLYQLFILIGAAGALWLFADLAVQWTGRSTALLLTLVMAVSGVWLQAVLISSVEIMLVFYLLAALRMVFAADDLFAGGRWPAAGLLLAGLVLVKNEGLLLAAALLLALLCTEALRNNPAAALSRITRLSGYALIALLPWLIQVRLIPAVSDEHYWRRLQVEIVLAGLERLPVIASTVAGRLLDWQLWSTFWLLIPWAALLTIRRLRRGNDAGLFFAAATSAYGLGIFFVYLISPWRDPAMQINASFDRVMLPLLPLVLLLFAAALAPKEERC